uniref:RNA-dependent RNA polymerase n=1 Tax=Psoroptes ovis TaxID=83912 RepID=A0A3B0QN55_PSOOV|nr:RNA-dependent RNA polymerase 1-like [Psoroptes ovis]
MANFNDNSIDLTKLTINDSIIDDKSVKSYENEPIADANDDDDHQIIVNERDDIAIDWALKDNHVKDYIVPITITVLKLRDTIINAAMSLKNDHDDEFQSIREFLDQYLIKLAQINCQVKENSYYCDDYLAKMNIDFYVDTNSPIESIIFNFINNFCQSMYGKPKEFRLILSIPYDTLAELSNKLLISEIIDDYHAQSVMFSFGTIVNLCYYFNRYQLNSCEFSIKFRKNYRIEISFQTIQYIFLGIGHGISETNELYIELNSPPFLNVSSHSAWKRIRNLNKKDPYLIGYSCGYRIILKDRDILPNILKLSHFCKINNRNFSLYIGRIKNQQSSHDENDQMRMMELFEMIDRAFSNNFKRNYACRVLFKSYRILDRFLYRTGYYDAKYMYIFFDKIKSIKSDEMFEDCLFELNAQSDNHVIDLVYSFVNIYRNNSNRDNKRSNRISKHGNQNSDSVQYIVMRRAIMSPTRVQFFRPITSLRSRFSNTANLDYSLRLTLVEDNNRLLHASNSNIDFIKQNFITDLLKGIEIGERRYEFLGSSSSQMRENGVTLYAPDDQNRSAAFIRKMIGNLSEYKRKVSKYIARFGLVFSQALYYYRLDDTVAIYNTQDIKNNDYIFSDGCGIIAADLAKKIIESIQVPNNYSPSAFQIRHGGYKGMLVSYDLYAHKNMILFRDSMHKFESNDDNIGILKYSAPRPVYFNRPLLQILYEKKVSTTIFNKILQESTESLSKSLMFDQNAYELVQLYPQSNLNYRKLNNAGFSFLTEPFLRRILNHLLNYRLCELKCKARIKINPSYGRIAFGVIDETGILEYGQIFFQYSKMDEDGFPTKEKVILDNQEVMVTKFPCVSLGDVRKFRAVNIERLNHIVDCLVFPAKGERPHSDEMAGSDLDGDEYAIFWDTNLMFPGQNHPPMNFPAQQSPDSEKEISDEDIIRFYCEYIFENNVGTVANSHLMISDFHPQGLESSECRKLAELYSLSLDFQKNGVNAKIDPQYKPDSNWIRPDFMRKVHIDGQYYLSTKILGIIYRRVQLSEDIICSSDLYLLANQDNRLEKPNPNLQLEGWRIFEFKAIKAYDSYCHLVIDHMEMLDIETEAALISDLYDNHQEIGTYALTDLFKHFQTMFEEQAKGLSNDERLLLISAWYSICFERTDNIRYRYHNETLFGMPFLVPNQMIRLIKHVQNVQSLSSSSNISLPQKYIESKHIEMTCIVILFWMAQMNRIFHRQANLRTYFRIFNTKAKHYSRTNEHRLLKNLVKEQLHVIVNSHQNKMAVSNNYCYYDHEIISKLFNEYLLYLYDLLNQIETLIAEKDVKHLFLLKYTPFALNFIEKLNNMNDPPMNSSMKHDIVFKYKLFLKFLIRNFRFDSLNSQIDEFSFIINDKCVDFYQSTIMAKIVFLSGKIDEFRILDKYNSHINSYYGRMSKLSLILDKQIQKQIKAINQLKNNNNKTNLERFNVNYYNIKVIGSKTSISLLKCLIGNENFKNILPLFEIEM